MRHWTQQEREQQAALIQGWKPWEQSTGPRTEAGKRAAASNARKHGMRSAEWAVLTKQFGALMAGSREAVAKAAG